MNSDILMGSKFSLGRSIKGPFRPGEDLQKHDLVNVKHEKSLKAL